jgi:hypothetical protein
MEACAVWCHGIVTVSLAMVLLVGNNFENLVAYYYLQISVIAYSWAMGILLI